MRASCPWCRRPLILACCGSCLNKEGRRPSGRRDAATAAAETLTQILTQWKNLQARALLVEETRARVAARVADLRSQVERRAAALRTSSAQLEKRKAELVERRRQYESSTAECSAAKRRLDAKKVRLSRDQFLKDPARHSAALNLGAFHIYQELSVATLALQENRKRRCLALVDLFPWRWVLTNDGDQTMTLGQVPSLTAPGVLQEEEFRDLSAAVSFLLPLVNGLAACLDVTLPFPCSTGHSAESDASVRNRGGSVNLDVTDLESKNLSAQWWALPCALHPFTGRWRYFSVYDRICTSEFSLAVRLVEENIRQLCTCQGDPVPPRGVKGDLGTLQLLAHLLSSPSLGCLCPLAPPTAAKTPSSIKKPETEAGPVVPRRRSSGGAGLQREGKRISGRGGKSGSNCADGEWTILLDSDTGANVGR